MKRHFFLPLEDDVARGPGSGPVPFWANVAAGGQDVQTDLWTDVGNLPPGKDSQSEKDNKPINFN